MKRIVTILCVFIYFHSTQAQIINIYKNPKSNSFTFLEREGNTLSGMEERHRLFNIEFSGKIKNQSFITDSTFFKQYPLNNITDSVFGYANNFYNYDTLHCLSDSNIVIGHYIKFNYIEHLIDYNTEMSYRLILQSRWQSLDYPTHCNEYYFILKSKKYKNITNFDWYSKDSIEKYYKFSYDENKTHSFHPKNINSYLLLSIPKYLSNNSLPISITELDSNLQVIQLKEINYPLYGTIGGNYFNTKFETIDNKNYLTVYAIDLNDLTAINSGYIFECDTEFNIIDSLQFQSKYERLNYLNSNKGNQYFYFETDTSTVIHVTNAMNDTIRKINLPTKDKILISTDSLFYTLNSEIRPYIDIDISVYKWNKNGVFINKTSLTDLNLIKIDDYFPSKVFYDIDTFNNVFFGNSIGVIEGSNTSYITKSNAFNLESLNFISGTVIYDINSNCVKDSNETQLSNKLIELQLHNKSYFSTTNAIGSFKFTTTDTGHGRLIIHLENQRYFNTACKDTIDVIISDTSANPITQFLLQSPDCKLPKVSVGIGTPFLRRCFDNIYTLSLTNETADTISAAYVVVFLDDDLIPKDIAFSNAISLGNNSYRFNFYNLLPFQTILKNLKINVNCASTRLGQTHCVKAIASPYNTCIPVDFPRLTAESFCRNDSVLFIINRNALTNNYSIHYKIIANDTILHIGNLNFTASNNTQELSYSNPEGKTLRFESYQIPAYPNEDTILSSAIEGCGNAMFSTGFLTLFPQDDDVPFVDIDCRQNVGSFDPNEKSAQPSGFGDSLYILPNTPIEYTIHFQNKGSYAATFVQITDTLSPVFDITSFEFISSSHAFNFTILDSKILQFTSNNIYLPGEINDTLGSNGFIKFKISPKKSTPIGTIINNTAEIVFDYNDAIITNTVTRNVNNIFIKTQLISNIKTLAKKIETNFFPNPFNQTAIFSFKYNLPTQLTIFSLDGKILEQLRTMGNYFTINRNEWSNGIYLYELRDSNTYELLDIGKMILQ